MKKLLAAALLSTAVAPAFAQGYVALDVGQSKFKDACNGLPAGVTCDDNDTGYRFAGGYQYTPMWGVEVSYTDFGKARASGGGVSAEAKANSIQLAGTGTFPVGNGFSVIGKLGVARTEVKTSATATADQKANSTKATYGIGVQYDFTKEISGRILYEDFGTAGDNNTTGEAKMSLISAGVVFKF